MLIERFNISLLTLNFVFKAYLLGRGLELI